MINNVLYVKLMRMHKFFSLYNSW